MEGLREGKQPKEREKKKERRDFATDVTEGKTEIKAAYTYLKIATPSILSLIFWLIGKMPYRRTEGRQTDGPTDRRKGGPAD